MESRICYQIATNRADRVLAMLRNSGAPPAEYALLASFLLKSYDAAFSPPPELSEWRPRPPNGVWSLHMDGARFYKQRFSCIATDSLSRLRWE